MQIAKIDSNQNSNTTFKGFSRQAKEILNRGDVRTILNKAYGIKKREIKQLDSSSIKIKLLSEYFPSAKLNETAGIVLSAPMHNQINAKALTTADPELITKDSPMRFATYIKKAFDMINAYKDSIKQAATHPVAKERSKNISKVERRIKITIKDLTRAHNNVSVQGKNNCKSQLEKYTQKELNIDANYNREKGKVERYFADTVNNKWDEIARSPALRKEKSKK